MSKRNPNSKIRTGTHSLPMVGKTKDNKAVVAGVYDFHQALGMPLDFLFSELKDHDMVPDWLDFYRTALDNGMKHKNIMAKLYDPIEDAWGTEFANAVCNTFNLLHKSNMGAILNHYGK